MNDVAKTVGGFRSALQDLIVPELKALKVEMRGVREILERHEKKLESHDQMFMKLTEDMHERFNGMQKQMDERFNGMQKQMDERFDAMQKQMDERFEAMRKDNDQKFVAINERFVTVMDSIKELQKNTAIIMNSLDYTERLHKLELQMARLASKSEEKAIEQM